MAKATTFRPAIFVTDKLVVRIIEQDPKAMQALAHFTRHYILNMLAVHNPFDDRTVQTALTKAIGDGLDPYPAAEVQDLALLMVELEKEKPV